MSTSALNNEVLKAMRKDIDLALKPVADKYGLASLFAGNVTYSSEGGNFTFKLAGMVGGGKSPEAERYETLARFDQSLPSLGTTFKIGKYSYTITGANTGSKAICTRTDNGKNYLVPFSQLQARKEN